MIILSTIGILIGAFLGLRFKVLVLVPVALVGVVFFALIGIMTGISISSTALVLAALGLNFGYFGVTALRFAFVPALRLRGLVAPALSKSAS